MDTMITDNLTKHGQTMEELGLPEGSFFEVTFTDGSTCNEKDVAWSSMSRHKQVEYFGGGKHVQVCMYPVTSITVHHGDLETTIEVPKDCEVYQAIRSSMLFVAKKDGRHRVLGRCVGLVKNGKVVEERFLNGLMNEVQGVRL